MTDRLTRTRPDAPRKHHTGVWATLAVLAVLLIGTVVMYSRSDNPNMAANRNSPAATTGSGSGAVRSDATGANSAPKSRASDPTGANRSTPTAPPPRQ